MSCGACDFDEELELLEPCSLCKAASINKACKEILDSLKTIDDAILRLRSECVQQRLIVATTLAKLRKL